MAEDLLERLFPKLRYGIRSDECFAQRAQRGWRGIRDRRWFVTRRARRGLLRRA
jgi:hypothetical protein